MAKKQDKKPQANAPKQNKGKASAGKVVKVERSTPQTDKLKMSKAKPKPSHFNVSKEGADFKQIVRIANRDVPGYMTIADGLTLIYGVGKRTSKVVEDIFFKQSGKTITKVGHLSDEDILKIEDIIVNLDKHVPAWLLNRPKEREGNQAQYIMADLKLVERKELQRLGKIKSYRGLRLQWGLRVRGQKTKSSGRRHGTIGVNKKK
jgi:small subunit ribosomal protein S13